MKKVILLLAIILGIISDISLGRIWISSILSIGVISAFWFLINALPISEKFSLFPEIGALFIAVSPWSNSISKDPTKLLYIFVSILFVYFFIKFTPKQSFLLAGFFLLFVSLFLVNKPKDDLKGYLNTQTPVWLTDEQRREYGNNFNNPIVKLVHNKVINYSLMFLDDYAQHFQGDFLFISGDVREDTSKGGEIFIADFIFIILALIRIVKKKNGWEVVLIWLLLGPIPSALDFQPPNAQKAYLMIVPLTILSSYGASFLLNKMGFLFKPLVKYIR